MKEWIKLTIAKLYIMLYSKLSLIGINLTAPKWLCEEYGSDC